MFNISYLDLINGINEQFLINKIMSNIRNYYYKLFVQRFYDQYNFHINKYLWCKKYDYLYRNRFETFSRKTFVPKKFRKYLLNNHKSKYLISFINNNKEKINFNIISEKNKLTNKFINIFKNEINWELLLLYNIHHQNNKNRLILKYINNIDIDCWNSININISKFNFSIKEFKKIKKYINKNKYY